MNQFKIGDICEVVKAYTYPEYVGRHVTVTSNLEWLNCWQEGIPMQTKVYITDLNENGSILVAEPHQLKLIRRPGQTGEDSIFALFDTAKKRNEPKHKEVY